MISINAKIAHLVSAGCLDNGRRSFIRTSAKASLALAFRGDFIAQPEARSDNAITSAKSPWSGRCGFNLLEKYTLGNARPYHERDFDIIAELGFNFVRLPLDYRIWTDEKSGKVIEGPLNEIDHAIRWAQARRIHVSICLHRAPGYCVNPPEEKLNLWASGSTGHAAQSAFHQQWNMLALRYQEISLEDLSFNLVNEPGDISQDIYLNVVTPVIGAIHKITPGRFVLLDGLAWGTKPIVESDIPFVVQSTRGYYPMCLTHYRAPWVKSSSAWPTPQWPSIPQPSQFLYGKDRASWQTPLVIRLEEGHLYSRFHLKVKTVSGAAHLRVSADGVSVFDKRFDPGPGEGEWKSSRHIRRWNIYQATYDRAYDAALPAGCREVRIEVIEGDWLSFERVVLTGNNQQEVVINTGEESGGGWGQVQGTVTVDHAGNSYSSDLPIQDRRSLGRIYEGFEKAASAGGTVFVGEWGAYRHTPHDVTLAWMADCLSYWKSAKWGWALWNLSGAFGIFDSERSDVKYEKFRGRLLDRKMLEMLIAGR